MRLSSTAGRVLFATVFGVILGGLLLEIVALSLGAAPRGWLPWGLSIGTGALVAGLLASQLVERTVVRRLLELTEFLRTQALRGEDLRRLPPLGSDEVGEAADAVNALFARMTSLRVSVIETGHELAETQAELRLKEALAEKSEELEQRLSERALLFELLRISATELELSSVLEELAERLATALRLREMALLLRETDPNQGARFVVRAVRGFEHPDALVGRSIAPGEGVAGEVAEAGRPILIPDVVAEPEYLAFWGEAPREGSFAAFPIMQRSQLLGILALTRPGKDPLSPLEVRLLSAIADSVALAVRHAQLVDELRESSTHDELTGLANRRLLSTKLATEVSRSHRFDVPLSLIMADIDHFKHLNDRHGHAAGDEALKGVAALMRASVRRIDTVVRYGGEEFVIVLPQTGADEAVQVAEKLRVAVEARTFRGGNDQPEGRLTVSLGVASLRAEDDATTLLSRADEALYAAKHAGRNRVAPERRKQRAI